MTEPSILERLVKNHQDRKRLEIYCPEIGETVYASPMTIGDRKRISAKNPNGDEYDYMVCAVIEKAENAAGERIFGLDAKETLLKHVPEQFVRRIVRALNEEPGTIEDQKKD